ncbi:hypothetical protein AB0R12_00245 [Streptomyces niveus]|uniref:hypothetical protein n=1 Tax=Streptomyces niveus TaxID=193462 RepID=UPI0034128C29
MIDLLIQLAWLVVCLIIFCVTLVVWDVSAPLRRRMRIGHRWQVWVTARAMRRVRNAVVHLAVPGVPVVPEVPWVLTRRWSGVVEAVKAWYALMPAALVMHMIKLFALIVALLNVGTIVAAAKYVVENPPGSKTPAQPNCRRAGQIDAYLDGPAAYPVTQCEPGLDPLASLWVVCRDAVQWVGARVGPAVTDPWADTIGTAKVLTVIVLLVMGVPFVRATVPVLRRILDVDENGRRPWDHREMGPRPVRSAEVTRWQPVVVLLAVCGSVGLAYKQMESRSVLNPPRVSLKAAERVVWDAWRVRHGRVRRDRRGQLKEHAAQVVGALRALEARQDSGADPGKVFEDTAAMLLKIAQRYAEGRTLALLDPEELEHVTPAVSRERVRLLAFGVIVTGTVAGAMAVPGMTEQAATPLIGVVSLVTWSVLYGGRVVGAGLVDVMRGQSRS